MPHPDYDCEDCGVYHMPWSLHEAGRQRRELATRDGLAPILELFPGALADNTRTDKDSDPA